MEYVWMTHPNLAGQSVEVPVASVGYYQSKGWHIAGETPPASGGAGLPGPSAYDVAVSNGFVGTEAEWLASLQGADSTVPGPVSTVPGPPGPGFVQPSQADRTPVNHPVPATSGFTFTCPAGKIVQLTVSGGAGVALLINAGGGDTTWVGGTGTTVILSPGEVATVQWSTTAPTAIRTRVLLSLA